MKIARFLSLKYGNGAPVALLAIVLAAALAGSGGEAAEGSLSFAAFTDTHVG